MAKTVRKDPRDPAHAFVTQQNGVRLNAATRTEWAGLSRLILELQWETEPGWIEFEFDQPTCFTAVREIGGRSEFRLTADRPCEGDFIGAEHVSLIGAGTRIAVYATEMCRATVACCVLSPRSGGLESAVETIASASTSLMIRNGALHYCAALFAGPGAVDPTDPFSQALARAVLLAWAAAAISLREKKARTDRTLKGERLHRVLTFIRDELDEPIRITALAEVAGLSTTQFGTEFHLATGMTPQAWQMDARVRNAQRLMIEDPKGSLAEFAQLCGFSDQSHFSRVFLKIVGVSPTEWLNSET